MSHLLNLFWLPSITTLTSSYVAQSLRGMAGRLLSLYHLQMTDVPQVTEIFLSVLESLRPARPFCPAKSLRVTQTSVESRVMPVIRGRLGMSPLEKE